VLSAYLRCCLQEDVDNKLLSSAQLETLVYSNMRFNGPRLPGSGEILLTAAVDLQGYQRSQQIWGCKCTARPVQQLWSVVLQLLQGLNLNSITGTLAKLLLLLQSEPCSCKCYTKLTICAFFCR
jgi:hypothetical protein